MIEQEPAYGSLDEDAFDFVSSYVGLRELSKWKEAVREGERFNMKTGFQMYEDEFLERGRAEGKSELTRSVDSICSVTESSGRADCPNLQLRSGTSEAGSEINGAHDWRTITESKRKEAVQTDSVWLLFPLYGTGGKTILVLLIRWFGERDNTG